MKDSETFFCPANSHRQANVYIRILSIFWTSAITNFTNPVLNQKKSLNNMDLKGAKLLTCSEGPHVWDQPCKWHPCSHLTCHSGKSLNR